MLYDDSNLEKEEFKLKAKLTMTSMSGCKRLTTTN